MIIKYVRELFSRGTKIRLILVLVGYIVTSLFDMAGIVALVPLMALLTQPAPLDNPTGITSFLWNFLGRPSESSYAQSIAILVALAFSLKALVGIAFRWWSLSFLAAQQTQTTVGLFRNYLEAPFEVHRKTSSTNILHALGWITASAFSGIGAGISFLGESFTVITVVITLLILNPAVAAIVVALFGGVGGGFQFLIRKRNKAMSKMAQSESERSTKAVLHGVGGVKEIILRNNPGPFLDQFENAEGFKNKATRSKMLYTDLPKYFLEVLLVGSVAIISAYLFATGGSSQMLASMAIFGAAGFRLLPSITRMLASLNGLIQSVPSLEKLTAETRRLQGVKRQTGTPGLVNYEGTLELKDVSYEYVAGTRVLSNLSLSVPAGTSLALVGASGAGKSTLVDLLLGLQPPTSGEISCGGTDIHKNLIDWQNRIGYVPQDVFLMDASLRQNIVFDIAPEDIDEEWLAETVRLAQLGNLVENAPEGLDMVVGDRGIRLSGGQRQRIAIARALYRRPSVLILDEANSALDNETERQLTETIEGLAGEITVIVVAHRLSTVKGCSQFLVLDEGRADAIGTLAEVRHSSKVFANLAKLAQL